jgi:hypothetical protein
MKWKNVAVDIKHHDTSELIRRFDSNAIRLVTQAILSSHYGWAGKTVRV